MKARLFRLSIPLILASAITSAWPQDSMQTVSRRQATAASRGNFKVDSDLVLVNVTVTDARGRFVMGLDRQDFQISEEKTAQTLAYFSTEESPVSVGLVLDFSNSMAPKFRELKRAVAEFLKSANPADEFSLIEFRDRPEISAGFGATPEDIQNRVAFTKPSGNTALLDAVHLGLREMRKAKNPRKILLIVSDGGDNHSRFRAHEVETLALESDVEIYGIGIVDHSSARSQLELLQGPSLLNELTGKAGGRYFEIDDSRELPEVAETIGRELRHQYLLGYIPSNQQRDGRYRRIQVKVTRPPGKPRFSAYSKPGYFAPSD